MLVVIDRERFCRFQSQLIMSTTVILSLASPLLRRRRRRTTPHQQNNTETCMYYSSLYHQVLAPTRQTNPPKKANNDFLPHHQRRFYYHHHHHPFFLHTWLPHLSLLNPLPAFFILFSISHPPSPPPLLLTKKKKMCFKLTTLESGACAHASRNEWMDTRHHPRLPAHAIKPGWLWYIVITRRNWIRFSEGE